MGPGSGDRRWERDLDADLALRFGWKGGRFEVALTSLAGRTGDTQGDIEHPVSPVGVVGVEATPNPRTMRFGFDEPVHDGPSRWYESAGAAAGDPGVARLFAEVDRVANVLVGPDFVAVGLRRPDDWEALLAPVLAIVTEEFADPVASPVAPAPAPAPAAPGPRISGPARRATRLEVAWRDLGALRPADPADLAAVLAAAAEPDQARRQVAASLLREADPAAARVAWARLAADPVRAVRRATVDAVVDVGREALRPLLERALDDADAWVRWKALRGLVELGPGPSRAAISAKAEDPDFRVRLEAAAALRTP